MAVKLELTTDPVLGPGNGILRLSGLALPPDQPEPAELRIGIERNQGKDCWLGQGAWTAQAFHRNVAARRLEDGGIEARLGSDVVDLLATQGANVMFRMHVGWNETTEIGRLVLRNLLPSQARGAESLTVPPPPLSPPPTPSPEPEPEPEPEPTPPPPSPSPQPTSEPKGRIPLVPVALGLILAVLLGVGGFYLLGDGKDAKTEQPAPPVVAAPVEPDRNAIALWLQGGPAVAEMLEKAKTLFDQGHPDLGMVVLQHTAQQGSVDAHLKLAALYDPATWTAETSPMPEPDPETAAYWYEAPAEAGNPWAGFRLGALLTTIDPDGFQGRKGLDWLQKAAEAGQSEAGELLERLKAGGSQ